MSDDINLLPEDLKKKQDKTLKNRGNFSLDEIEFTDGQRLKKQLDSKIIKPKKEVIKKWFKPKINQKSDFSSLKNDNLPPISKPELKVEEPLVKKSIDLSKDFKKDNLKEKTQTNNAKPEGVVKPKNKVSLKEIINNFRAKLNGKNKNKEEDKSLDVNLLPFGSNMPTTRRALLILIIIFILAGSSIFIVYFGYYLYKEEVMKEYGNLENEFNIYVNDIKKYDDLIYEITAWQEKISEIENLLNKHVYWTKFFEKLEENTLNDVQFIGFAGTIDSSITLQAIAPNYETVSKQWIRLQEAEDFVEKVVIDGASMSSTEDNINISFSLTLDFVDDIFYKE